MPNDDTLTTAEVAERLRTDRKGVRRLIAAGALTPAKKLPGKTGAYLFHPAEVDALALERAS